MEIVAHRGSSFLAPENTLAAFKLGWEETTICELDVQPTLDGKLLVIHDDSTKRTTGADFKITEHPLRDLQKLDAGSWKGSKWMGEKLSSLEEVIAALPSEKGLFIEIKAGREVVPELRRVIQASGKERQLMLQSFSYPTCVEAKKALPQIPVYFLVAFASRTLRQVVRSGLKKAVRKANAAGLDGINVNPIALARAADVERIHAAGLKVHVWTVDDLDEAKRLSGLGIDGLTTNRPGWMKAELER